MNWLVMAMKDAKWIVIGIIVMITLIPEPISDQDQKVIRMVMLVNLVHYHCQFAKTNFDRHGAINNESLSMNCNNNEINSKQHKQKNKSLKLKKEPLIKVSIPSFVVNNSGNDNTVANFDGQQNECDYPFEIVEPSIEYLKKAKRLSMFTIRVSCDLLPKLIQDRKFKRNGLTSNQVIYDVKFGTIVINVQVIIYHFMANIKISKNARMKIQY